MSNSLETFLEKATSINAEIFIPIKQLTIIDLIGPDAQIFLHNLISNDVLHIKANEIRFAALCSHKGKVLATMNYWQIGQDCNPIADNDSEKKNIFLSEVGIRILVAKDLSDEIMNLLNRYKLKSKVLIIERKSFHLLGYSCPEQLSLHSFLVNAAPTLKTKNKEDLNINQLQLSKNHQIIFDTNTLSLLRYEDITIENLVLRRYLLICHSKHLNFCNHLEKENDIKKILAPKIENQSYWDWLNIRSGEIQIVKKTSNLFIPQILNLDLLDAVNFNKGCYPGQEVIARSHYRGQIKRRLKLGHTLSAEVLDDVYSNDQDDTPVGRVLMTAPNLANGYDCLIEMNLKNHECHLCYLSGDSNKKITFLDLPYAIPMAEKKE